MYKKLYKFIGNKNDQTTCSDLSEDACKQVPHNFFLHVLSNTFTKLGDTLSNPKTVLTWLMSYVSAPVYLISLIVPLRESGSMIPQVLFAKIVNRTKIQKWIWIIGSLLQFATIVSIGFIALHFEKEKAGWLFIVALVIFSLSRSMSSLASKSVMGKTIPKTRRGRLKGVSTSVAGFLTLGAGLFLLYQSKSNNDLYFYTSIIFFASTMWLIGAFIYSRIKEFPTNIDEHKIDKSAPISAFKILKNNKQFRKFIVARTLLLCTALSSPFYILLAHNYVGKEAYLLGLFIIARGLASAISSPIWGKHADRSSKNVMAYAVLIASVIGILVYGTITFSDEIKYAKWIYPLAFFLLAIAHEGVRIGRKTYVVDMATGDDRVIFVSVSNSIIGILLLVVGSVSALVSVFSVESVIFALSLLGLLGAYKSYQLPNVE